MSKQLKNATRVAMLLAAAVVAGPAAAITCHDGSQRVRVQGNWIATPYCQDLHLAQVARERGYPASVEKIRNNPNYKKELCRGVFTDIRVSDTCLNAGIPEWRR
jgi:hypothetical protein